MRVDQSTSVRSFHFGFLAAATATVTAFAAFTAVTAAEATAAAEAAVAALFAVVAAAHLGRRAFLERFDLDGQ